MCLKGDFYRGGWWCWERVPALPLLHLHSKPQCSSVHIGIILKRHVSQRLFLGTWDISHTRCSEQRKNAMKKNVLWPNEFEIHCILYFRWHTIHIRSFFFFFGCVGLPGATWDLVPWSGIEPRPPELRAQSLSHWTTREVPCFSILSLWEFLQARSLLSFFKSWISHIYQKSWNLLCSCHFIVHRQEIQW